MCASGSNIGLLKSFPVGQNHDLTLYPMTFEEFVMASGNAPLARAFARVDRNETVHVKLSAMYNDYLFVGGMPAGGIADTFGWVSGKTAELEFIVENAHGDIIPIEIKSGKHTKAKSLDVYLQRYDSKKAYKLCDLVGGFRQDRVHTRPLYYTCHAAKSLVQEGDLNEYF